MTPKGSENNKRENLKMMHSWQEKSNTLEASKLRKVWKWFGRSIPTARLCFDVIVILVGLGQQCQCFLLLHMLLVMAQGSQEKWAKSNGSSAFPFCMSCIWFSVWVFSFFSDPWRDQAFWCILSILYLLFYITRWTLFSGQCSHTSLYASSFLEICLLHLMAFTLLWSHLHVDKSATKQMCIQNLSYLTICASHPDHNTKITPVFTYHSPWN